MRYNLIMTVKTQLNISEIGDAIGHPVEIGDYVTAVWSVGEVALFKVKSFEKAKYGSGIGLRLTREFFQDNCKSNDKTCWRGQSQVTWVHPDWVFLKKLNQ